MLKYNSCKIQSYGISWSLKCNVVLGNCYAEVIAIRKKVCVWKSCMIQVMVNSWSCEPYHRNLGEKISDMGNAWEM